ncbi:SsgA family sporulation/cell division regulator [Streptomyces sp. CA-294286]|uniref:SsgA family sporulation/cell division regulator n=1 Tax=Streptomyces sp. CA-294286 TaxID=3240070 RepID=UPI003D932229
MSRTAEEPSVPGTVRPAFEVHLCGRLVTDAPISPRIPVALRYDPDADPRTVEVVLQHPGPGQKPGRHAWAFPRALLEAGLRSPAEQGDVRIWPCGRVQAVLELHAGYGVALVQLDCAPLVRFLRRTYAPSVT